MTGVQTCALPIYLAGASISDDDDDETKQKTWDLFNDKEKKRIFRIIKNGS